MEYLKVRCHDLVIATTIPISPQPLGQIDASVDGFLSGKKGKLILIQRHGQAAKNVELRPVRFEERL
jgi:hypothetical protein